MDSQTNTNEWAKAGVMLREGTAADAVYGGIFISPTSGVTFQQRSITGAPTTSTILTGVTAPVWLRLTRSGTSISAAYSTTGSAWTTVGAAWTGPAAATLTVGLAATSHRAELAGTVVYSSVQVSGNVKTVASPAFARGYVYGTYVDEPLAILLVSGAAADRRFMHANHLYSIAALTDNSGGVVERYRYDAYGQRTVLAPDGITTRTGSSYGNQLGFTGRYLDKETGLWYFRSRYYSASLGRFANRDPLGYVDGSSLYTGYFVPNMVDPLGLASAWCESTQVNVELSKTPTGVGAGFFAGLDFEFNVQLRGQYKKCLVCCEGGGKKYQHEVQLQGRATWQASAKFDAWVWIIPVTGAVKGQGYIAGSAFGTYDECTEEITGGGSFEGRLGLEVQMGVGNSKVFSVGGYGGGNVGVRGRVWGQEKGLYASADYVWDLYIGAYAEGLSWTGRKWRINQTLFQRSGGDVLFGNERIFSFL